MNLYISLAMIVANLQCTHQFMFEILTGYRPFADDPAKQARYEDFLSGRQDTCSGIVRCVMIIPWLCHGVCY